MSRFLSVVRGFCLAAAVTCIATGPAAVALAVDTADTATSDIAATDTATSDAATSDAATADTSNLPPIVVTAMHLDDGRARIQTQTGASTYVIDEAAIAAAPGGDNQLLNQVIMQAPDVAQDSFRMARTCPNTLRSIWA